MLTLLLLSISPTKELIDKESIPLRESKIAYTGVLSNFACLSKTVATAKDASLSNPLLVKKAIVVSTSVALNSKGFCP